jgi:hypothetical protein
MNGSTPDLEAQTLVIDRELRELLAAVALVASGASARVTVSNLRFGSELLPEAMRLGRERGVAVRPIWSVDDTGPRDITIERLDTHA